MTAKQKKWIDNATLVELLRKWRFAPPGDPWFQGETGEYYSKVMFAWRDRDPAAWTRASKTVGWRL
jgi:uncharacterized membrane protein